MEHQNSLYPSLIFSANGFNSRHIMNLNYPQEFIFEFQNITIKHQPHLDANLLFDMEKWLLKTYTRLSEGIVIKEAFDRENWIHQIREDIARVRDSIQAWQFCKDQSIPCFLSIIDNEED